MKSNPCPICKGRGKTLAVDLPASDWDMRDIPHNTVYEVWKAADGGDDKPAAFFTCAGCNGSGQASDYLARVLSGEFPPAKPFPPEHVIEIDENGHPSESLQPFRFSK